MRVAYHAARSERKTDNRSGETPLRPSSSRARLCQSRSLHLALYTRGRAASTTATARQHYRNDAAAADCAVEVDLSSHRPRQIARDCQTKPNTRILACRSTVDLEERLEDLHQLIGRHADPGVADCDHHVLAAWGCSERDFSFRGSELDRVADDVEEDLAQLQRISP